MSEFNNLNIRVDKTLKNDAENVLDEFGISMTTAITMFLKQVVREQGIPFDLHLGTPNAETLAAMGILFVFEGNKCLGFDSRQIEYYAGLNTSKARK